MAPRGKSEFLLYVHTVKNKLWNSCFVSTFFTFLCYKSDLSVRLSCIFLFNLLSENRRRFVVGTFVVVNGAFPLKVWRYPWNAAGTARRNNEAARWVKEGRCSRYGSAIYAHFVYFELTYLLPSFRSWFSTEKVSSKSFFSVFSFGKVLLTLTY